jgi:hypothetical protein
MRTRSFLLLFVGLVALDCAGPGAASGQVLDPIQYTMSSGSVLEYGCMGPCACPVIFSGPVKGQFTFYRTGIDPLFTHYALLNIDWTYTLNDGPGGTPRTRSVRGNGTYDVGGEVALEQRLTLDVTTDDTLTQHFDSGLVPVHAPFPVIDVEAHLRIDTCLDSVFHVIASPFGTASVGPGANTRLVQGLAPNPSRGDIVVVLSPRAAGHARVDVLDVRGRVVATLLDRAVVPGELPLRWDGHDLHGRSAGPGVYWVRVVADGRTEGERFVRLD